MSSKYGQKIAICYSCSGESYRESALKRLIEDYFDDENVYFFIITDDKNYFSKVERKNLFVNELKDFYEEYPLLEKNEALIESKDKNEYAEKFVRSNYLYSFSLMRFHLLQAYRKNIKNVFMMCTDTKVNFDALINDNFFVIENTIYNAVSEWDCEKSNFQVSMISEILKSKYGYETKDPVRVLDAAGRFFCFNSTDTCKKFFDVWNEVIEYLYENDMMYHFRGNYVYNDEYLLAPIYQMFGLNNRNSHAGSPLFLVNHNPLKERFWRICGGYPDLMEHTNYEEFLKINNLQDG